MKAARPRSHRWWLALSVLPALIGASLLVLVVAPELQTRHSWLAMAASFAPYGWLAWLLAAVMALCAARGRTRLGAAALAAGLVVHTGILWPYLPMPASAVAGSRPTLSVLAINLRFGLADLTELSAAVNRFDPDIVVATEVTTRDAEAFRKDAWTRRLPHQAGRPGRDFDHAVAKGDASGTMVLSRYPVSEISPIENMTFTNLSVRVAAGKQDVTLIAAHPVNPVYGTQKWLRDGQLLALEAARSTAGPLIVAGDLNATAEHITLRNLLARARLNEATQGWLATYPANRAYPPLIQIDHILTSDGFSTLDQDTVQIGGTDHLGLFARLALR